MHNGRTVYVVDGSRTPFLKAQGKPGPFTASDLAVAAGKPLLLRQPFEPSEFDEVILGCAAPSADEVNIGRVAALRLGCGDKVQAWTVMRNCASGMQALDAAATNIALGRSDLVLAGGTESMSHAPILYNEQMVLWLAKLNRAKKPLDKLKVFADLRPGHLKPIIGLLRGLTDPVVGLSMGQTAENIAYRFGINREQMDTFSMRSHLRLALAQDADKLEEIETVFDKKGNSYDADDGIRRDSSMEKLAKLRPVFDRDVGNITAGNSAQITDGCCWVILASEKAVKDHNLEVLGRIVDSQWAGLDPAEMGLGPVYASTPIMQRHNLGFKDIDNWEINEAFAAQVLGCLAAWRDKEFCTDELGLDDALGDLDQETLNVDGGSVAIGHPVGASGARIVLHLLHVLKDKNQNRGMASICIGGGLGGAMLLERAA